MHYVNVLWSHPRKLSREVSIQRVLLRAGMVSLRQSTLDCSIGRWLVLSVKIVDLYIFDTK